MDEKGRHAGGVPVDLERVRALVEPIAVAHGVRLFDVEWTTGRAGRILRLTIERSGPSDEQAAGGSAAAVGGVSLADCVRVSRDASTALDVDDLIPTSYNLEVSSPGLDRPLRSAEELRGLVGETVKTKLRRPAVDGQRVLRGRLIEVSEKGLRMEVDGKEHSVLLSDLDETTRVLDFGGKQPDRRNRRGKRGRHPAKAGRRGDRCNVASDTSGGRARSASRKGS